MPKTTSMPNAINVLLTILIRNDFVNIKARLIIRGTIDKGSKLIRAST